MEAAVARPLPRPLQRRWRLRSKAWNASTKPILSSDSRLGKEQAEVTVVTVSRTIGDRNTQPAIVQQRGRGKFCLPLAFPVNSMRHIRLVLEIDSIAPSA